jgi:hypothetical protein
LSEQRRWIDFRRAPAEAHRPARRFEWADGWVLHRLHDAAPLEIRHLGRSILNSERYGARLSRA